MIQVKDMAFGYAKDRMIFSGLSLTFREKFNAIIGPNASGKSTFLKCLFGLLPASGKIFYEGRDVRAMSHEEKMARIAYLPQEETKAAGFTVFEAVLLGRLPRLHWKVTEEDTAAVMDVLSLLHLEKLAFLPFARLSGGQQKLVSIAQTLVRKPQLVLMDEPTNSLDLQKQLELCETVRTISQTHDITFILVLHDLGLAARFADEAFVFAPGGGLYAHGKPTAVIHAAMLREVYGVDAQILQDEAGIPIVAARASLRTVGAAPLPQERKIC
ncbi:MAG: ABC transporter ATP-binding protein [Schwartzia sp. (in: firmicutes)]